ncbi:MAG: hypothetical protein ACLGIA_14235 [Actinomycetes bacterium]
MRAELGTLSKDNATRVARHLVMTFQLLDDDPHLALAHAQAAQRRAGRVGLVREATGLAAYRAGAYDLALRELRAARRLTGSQVHVPVMADCERGLGRPERALALASSPEARTLSRALQLELLIVAAGARQDLGQHDAAVVMLQVPELDAPHAVAHPRLLSAYADALEAAGRQEEAVEWLHKAAGADVEGETGAAERLGYVEQELITDLLEDTAEDDESSTQEQREPTRGSAGPGDVEAHRDDAGSADARTVPGGTDPAAPGDAEPEALGEDGSDDETRNGTAT